MEKKYRTTVRLSEEQYNYLKSKGITKRLRLLIDKDMNRFKDDAETPQLWRKGKLFGADNINNIFQRIKKLESIVLNRA